MILFEQWAGHGLLSEKVTRPHVRANRPILIPSVLVRHGCQFLSSLVRTLAKLPGGLGRFLSCRLGSHMSRLRHLGWNQCSHGLTSRPFRILSSSMPQGCIVCEVLGYPRGSASVFFGWHIKAPTLHRSVHHAFPPLGLYRG